LALLGLFAGVFILWFWSIYYGLELIFRLFAKSGAPSLIHITKTLTIPSSVLSASLATVVVASCSLTASIKAFLATRESGGSYVATALGGIPLGETESVLATPAGRAREKILRDVVSEMSLAASLPEPDIYLLPQEVSVNALTAGFGQDDAALILTKGALKYLDRAELSGLVGHELSHILNGDTRLNSLLAGGLKGFFFLLQIGLALPPFLPLVLAFGGIGYLSGQFLMKALNRRREYLADAYATQFTRDPRALARALIKIGGLGERRLTRARQRVALEYQHLFMVEPNQGWLRLFKTHPPLAERIWALWPEWDGHWADFEKNPIDYLQSSSDRTGLGG
jgi:Zn-dependent protease with chaperone function